MQRQQFRGGSGAQSPRRANMQVREIALPDENLMLIAGRGLLKAADRHRTISLAWVLGLLLAIFASGLTPSEDQVAAYERRLDTIDYDSLAKAEEDLAYMQQRYYNSKGWFFQCDANCQANKMMLHDAQQRWREATDAHNRAMKEAKSKVGVFSVYGVDEARNLFWKKVAGGSAYAKRATMYDVFFEGIRSLGSSDRDGSSRLLAVVFHMLRNITVGAIGALVTFLWSVWSVIVSYGTSVPETAAFYTMAALAATATVATFFLGLAAAGVGVASAMVSVAKANMAVEGERRRMPIDQNTRQY